MAMKRGYPREGNVKSNPCVGPNYDNGRFYVPSNANVDAPFGDERDSKTIQSEAGLLFEGGGAPLHKGQYDEFWEGK